MDEYDPLDGIPYVRSLFDQDEVFQDGNGRNWPIDRMPPETARQHLDDLRQSSLSWMVAYTNRQVEAVDAARAHGFFVPNGWEPSSAQAMDQCMWLTLEGDPQARRPAVATAWLDSRPLVQALERRASQPS